MGYKLLIFDLDGTAIPNKSDGMPTEHLVKVIKKIQTNLKVCIATGRPLFNAKPIIQKLNLTHPCIISGGAQIIDPKSEKILWEKDIDEKDVRKIIEVILPYTVNTFFSDDEIYALPKDKKIQGPERIIYVEKVLPNDTEIIMKALGEIESITAHKVNSWTPSHFDIHITHREATKKHALKILLKMLNIEKNDVIAAGDGNNDLPLFEMASYKIAMGNAMEELKSKADFIAGNADEDGLAIALEKKLL